MSKFDPLTNLFWSNSYWVWKWGKARASRLEKDLYVRRQYGNIKMGEVRLHSFKGDDRYISGPGDQLDEDATSCRVGTCETIGDEASGTDDDQYAQYMVELGQTT